MSKTVMMQGIYWHKQPFDTVPNNWETSDTGFYDTYGPVGAQPYMPAHNAGYTASHSYHTPKTSDGSSLSPIASGTPPSGSSSDSWRSSTHNSMQVAAAVLMCTDAAAV